MTQHIKILVLRLARPLPDKPYIYLFYWIKTGMIPRLKSPKGFGQKIQWLKLNGNLERFAPYADKYTVREYVKRTIGAQYLVPLIGAWDTVDEIPFDNLPERFVLKVTNGCGYNYICKDKSLMDREAVKRQIKAWQRENFFRLEREPQYKHTKPRIICEQYLEDDSKNLRDYKFHCAGGVPCYVQVDIDRFTGHKSEMRDMQWGKVPINPADFGDIEIQVPKPKAFDEMVRLAARLAEPFPYVRVDLYEANGKPYFGELTFTPGSGTVVLQPAAGEIAFGNLIDLHAYSQPLNV